MSTANFRILSAARFTNTERMTGRTPLDVSGAKNYTSMANAIKYGVPTVVKEKDGKNFVVIEGPNGQMRHHTI
jgi:hypothetical protein